MFSIIIIQIPGCLIAENQTRRLDLGNASERKTTYFQ